MQAPLTDIAYADTVATSAQWVAGSTDDKNAWILQASVWIATNYLCTDWATDGIEFACALLADKAAQGLLYPAKSPATGASISSKSSTVAGITCSVEYMTANGVDPAQYARDVLGAECTRLGGSNTIYLMRG